jgi:hypothetical protein
MFSVAAAALLHQLGMRKPGLHQRGQAGGWQRQQVQQVLGGAQEMHVQPCMRVNLHLLLSCMLSTATSLARVISFVLLSMVKCC